MFLNWMVNCQSSIITPTTIIVNSPVSSSLLLFVSTDLIFLIFCFSKAAEPYRTATEVQSSQYTRYGFNILLINVKCYSMNPTTVNPSPPWPKISYWAERPRMAKIKRNGFLVIVLLLLIFFYGPGKGLGEGG